MPNPEADVGLSITELEAILTLGDDTAIAAAIRLVEMQLRVGGPRDDARTARRLHLRPKEWRETRALLLNLFEIRDGYWIHPGVADRQAARIQQQQARSARARRGWARRKAQPATAAPAPRGQPPAPEPTPAPDRPQEAARREALPPRTAGPGRDLASSKKEAFERGVALLMNAGASQRQARDQIGYLRKNYSEDEVSLAIARTERHRPSEPFSYMQTVARNLSADGKTKSAGRKREEKPRPIATPETMGLSPGLAKRIRDNARRKNDFLTRDPDTGNTSDT